MTTIRGEIIGDYAHDSPDTTTSFPIKMGLIAKNHDGSIPGTDVAEDDRVSLIGDRSGIPYVNLGHPFFFQTTLSYAAATTAASPIISAPTTGTSIYITDIILTSDTGGAMSFVNRVTASAITLLNVRIQPGGGFFQHSFINPIKASTADTTTAVVNIGLTTGMTTSTAFISGYFGL